MTRDEPGLSPAPVPIVALSGIVRTFRNRIRPASAPGSPFPGGDSPGMAFLLTTSTPPTFLTAGDVPGNTLGLRPGDGPFRLRESRRILRTGYRLSAAGAYGEALEVLSGGGKGYGLRRELSGLLRPGEGVPGSLTARDEADLAWAVARCLVRSRGLGGAERGVWVEEFEDPGKLRVVSTRRAWVGTRLPPSGSGEDAEGGRLMDAKAVVVVKVESFRGGSWEVLSGDLLQCPVVGNCPECGRGFTAGERDADLPGCPGCGIA